MAAPKRGRPSKCSQKHADDINNGLSEGKSLSQVCRDLKLGYSTVFNWMKVHSDTFFVDSPRAYEAGHDRLADECIEIADDGARDTIITDDGREITNNDVIQRSRLRIDTRLRLLGKWSKKYADRTINDNHNYNTDIPLDEMSTAELNKIAAEKPK